MNSFSDQITSEFIFIKNFENPTCKLISYAYKSMQDNYLMLDIYLIFL